MGLESVTYISDLVATNPVGATDPKSQGDDHLRNIKLALLNTFPNITGEVVATHAQISALAGGTLAAANGSNLTNLNASNIASGTLDDGRLSSNIPRKDASNVFTHNGGIQASGETPRMSIFETDGGENGKGWSIYASAGVLNISLTEDAQHPGLTNAVNGFRMARNGMAVTEVELNATALDFNGDADISGTLTVGGLQTIAYGDPSIQLVETDAGTNEKAWWIRAQGSSLLIQGRVDGGSASGASNIVAITRATGATSAAEIELNATTLDFNGDADISGTLVVGGAARAGTAATSTSATLVAGQIHNRSANTTVDNLGAGRWVAVQNTSTSAITLSQGSGVTLELGGTTTTGNRTLGPKGFAFIYFRANNTATVQGSGVS